VTLGTVCTRAGRYDIWGVTGGEGDVGVWTRCPTPNTNII
jgi:hypothetical protein